MEKEPATVSRMGPTDGALVEASRAGETWATEALYRRYIDLAYSLAYRLIGRDTDLDDVVQDAFIECLRSLDRLAAPQAFAAWLKQIVIRTAQRALRRRRMLDRLGLRWFAAIDPDGLGTMAGSAS